MGIILSERKPQLFYPFSAHRIFAIIMSIKKRVGKPKGTRSKEGLHDEIYAQIEAATKAAQEAGKEFKGITAFAIAKTLDIPRPTIVMYLDDLVKLELISFVEAGEVRAYSIRKQEP